MPRAGRSAAPAPRGAPDLAAEQAAEILHISPRQVYYLLRSGRLGKFVDEYGLVQYRPAMHYIRASPCEISGCSALRVSFAAKRGRTSGPWACRIVRTPRCTWTTGMPRLDPWACLRHMQLRNQAPRQARVSPKVPGHLARSLPIPPVSTRLASCRGSAKSFLMVVWGATRR